MSADNDSRSEDALRNALRRREAPEGFADRVLALVAERCVAEPVAMRRESWARFFGQSLMRWAATAGVCVALIAGGVYYRNVQRERAQGEAAKQRLILALRIAGSKLQLAKSKVQHVRTSPNENQE